MLQIPNSLSNLPNSSIDNSNNQNFDAQANLAQARVLTIIMMLMVEIDF